MGDFNGVIDNDLDIASSEKLQADCVLINVTDAWRVLHADDREYVHLEQGSALHCTQSGLLTSRVAPPP